MFRFSELQDNQRNVFFRLPHRLIADKIWRALPKSSHGVLPVIGCHANESGHAYPSEERIAGLCGLTCKTVRDGIKHLEDVLPGFAVKHYVSRRGKRAKSYRFGKQPTDGKDYLAFYRRWIDGGNWYVLHSTPSAWSVYPVLRHFAFPPDYEDTMGGEDMVDAEDLKDVYAERPFDFCEAEERIICEYAGISRNSLHSARVALEHAEFIEWDSDNACWRVYRRPHSNFKRGYLNSQLEKRGM